MKAALITGDLGPGGGEVAMELPGELRRLGWKAELYWDSPVSPPEPAAGCTAPSRLRSRASAARAMALAGRQAQAALVRTRPLGATRRDESRRLRRGTRWIQARVASWQPDVLHTTAHLATSRLGLIEAVRAPVVLTLFGNEASRIADPAAWERLWPRIAAIHETITGAAAELGAPRRIPVRVAGPGVPAALRARPQRRAPWRSPRSDAELRLLSAGPLTWEQGHEHVLRAMQLLRAEGPRVSYRIAGRGPHEDAILFDSTDMGLAECVRVGGGLESAELLRDLEGADAVIHPAIMPTASPVAEAALAAGLPVIATSRGGLGDRAGVNTVPPGDPAALADAMRGLGRGRGFGEPAPASGSRELAAALDEVYRAALGW